MLCRSTRWNAGKGVATMHPYLQFVTKGIKNEVVNRGKVYKRILKTIFTQVPTKEGIKQWGEDVIAAIVKELKQLQDGVIPGRPVIEPVNHLDLTIEDKKKHTLEAVKVVKEKRCGKIKATACANGSKQRRYLKEFETVASPILSLYGLIGPSLIDIYKYKDVATCDVPGALLHPELP